MVNKFRRVVYSAGEERYSFSYISNVLFLKLDGRYTEVSIFMDGSKMFQTLKENTQIISNIFQKIMSHLWGGSPVIEIDIVIYFRYLERELPLKYISPMIVPLIWVTSSGSTGAERWPWHQKACILFTLLWLIHSESLG